MMKYDIFVAPLEVYIQYRYNVIVDMTVSTLREAWVL